MLIIGVLWIPLFGENVKFDIFVTSDVHGNLCRQNSGLIRVGMLLDKIGRNENTFLVDCGDLIQGGAVNRLEKGKLMMKTVNLLDYDFMVLGNHDFDFGVDNMVEVYSAASAEILSANVNFDKLKTLPCKIIERNGVKIGFIGMTERNLKWRLVPQNEIKFLDNDKALLGAIRTLTKEKADIIVLLMHDGLYFKGGTIFDIAKKFPMIDLIIGSHTHTVEVGKVIRNSYYVQGAPYAESLAHIVIEFDTAKRQTRRIVSELLNLESVANQNVPNKYQEIYDEWRTLQKTAGRKIEIDCSYFRKELSLQENLSLTFMKEFCNDGDVYINLLQVIEGKNYDVRNLNLFALSRLFPYEDNYMVIELDADELAVMREELSEVAKKYGNKLFIYHSNGGKKHKYKVVTTQYILSGMGKKESKIRAFIK